MIESPKARFQLSAADVEFVAKLVNNDSFLRAVDTALAQMMWESVPQNDSVIAQANYHRLSGATHFIETFVNLKNIPPPPPKPLNPSNLDWSH